MAHEITTTDNVVLTGTPAWHGLGVVVENAPTPAEALKIAGLDWSVEQWPLYATNGQGQAATKRLVVEKSVANVRTDTETILGLVGTNYQPIQNADLADFCHLLAQQGDEVKVETAGSIRGGAKVWFLLRGDSFSVRARSGKADDELRPFICVSNGHDGNTALRCTPTTVRVVCSNTLHAVIPSYDPDRARMSRPVAASFVACHTGDVRKKVEQARAALGLYRDALTHQRDLIDRLVGRDWSSETVGRFLVQCYASTVEPIPGNPTNEQEAKAAAKARDAVRSMLARFDLEAQQFGPTAWVAVNAFTGWDQHDRRVNFRDPARAHEQRVASSLFGDKSAAALAAFAIALSASA